MYSSLRVGRHTQHGCESRAAGKIRCLQFAERGQFIDFGDDQIKNISFFTNLHNGYTRRSALFLFVVNFRV
jgi:hypothetical protein